MTLPIITERLVLRRFARADLSDVLAFASQTLVARVTSGTIDPTEEGIRRYIDLQNSNEPLGSLEGIGL